MVDETVSSQNETTTNLSLLRLQEELKAIKADRDYQLFEKGEIVARANGFAKERDELRDALGHLVLERDRLKSNENRLLHQEQAAIRRAEEAEIRIAKAEKEIIRLEEIIANIPPSDPIIVLQTFVSEKVNGIISWARNQVPVDSPLRVALSKSLVTAQQTIAVTKPKIIELINRAKEEIQSRVNKE